MTPVSAPLLQAGCHVNSADIDGAFAPHAAREPLGVVVIGAALYCICRRPFWPGVGMTSCDKCEEWFHNTCVGIHTPLTEADVWICPACQGQLDLSYLALCLPVPLPPTLPLALTLTLTLTPSLYPIPLYPYTLYPVPYTLYPIPYTPIPIYPYIHIPLYPYTPIPVYPYALIPLYSYTPIPLYPYTPIPIILYPYTPIPLNPYTHIPIYPFTPISLYPYTPLPLQRTCADKIPAIRFWGGVGGADIKNLYTPLAPQTRRTTEY